MTNPFVFLVIFLSILYLCSPTRAFANCKNEPPNYGFRVPPCEGQKGACYKNPKGDPGGFVASTASVGKDVFIGPKAQVCAQASVEGKVQIRGGLTLSEEAKVSGELVLTGASNIRGKANFTGKGSFELMLYDYSGPMDIVYAVAGADFKSIEQMQKLGYDINYQSPRGDNAVSMILLSLGHNKKADVERLAKLI